MERKIAAVIASGLGKLCIQAFRADTDSHAGELIADIEGIVPEQDVPVQVPVVIVRGSPVMGLARTEFFADLHQEGRAMLPDKCIFPLLRGKLRIEILQLLRCDERDFGSVEGKLIELRKLSMQVHLGSADR